MAAPLASLVSSQRGLARMALLALTTVWGSTFVVIPSALQVLSPFVLIAVRFALAGALLVALRPASLPEAWRALGALLPLSLLMLAGFGLQTFGLAETSPSRSAFLTSLSVVLVPLIEVMRTRRPPRGVLVAAVLIATAGVYLLFRPIALEWGRGDSLSLAGAVAFAFYVVELGRVSRKLGPTSIVVAQSLTILVLASALSPLVETPRLDPRPLTFVLLAYLALVCTALTFYLMTWAQARVDPIEAGIIYTLEPVLAAAFSISLGREPFTLKVVLGGALILAAMVVSGLGAQARPDPAARRATPTG